MREIQFGGKNTSAYIFETAEELASFAAKMVVGAIRRKPDLTLGLATGSTPVPLYRRLAEAVRAGEISFANVKTFNLDEYYPISPKDPQSFRYFMEKELFDHVDLPAENIHFPQGDAPDGEKEAERYHRDLCRNGAVDLQILGIGSDGHIGFNEPDRVFPYGVHTVTLTEETRKDNARFFESLDQVPTHAITMGIGNIMSAEQVIFMATGKNKAAAVRAALRDDPDPKMPAGILQFHKNVTFLLDEEAASAL